MKTLINYLYENKHYDILLLNQNIQQYLFENINIYSNIFNYLYEFKKYDIIYNNEILNEYLKYHYGLYILNIDDINNDFDCLDLKEDIEKKFHPIKIIWI